VEWWRGGNLLPLFRAFGVPGEPERGFSFERGESGIDQTFFGAAKQMNLYKSAGVTGRVLFSF
jgi:hypothetical protein